MGADKDSRIAELEMIVSEQSQALAEATAALAIAQEQLKFIAEIGDGMGRVQQYLDELREELIDRKNPDELGLSLDALVSLRMSELRILKGIPLGDIP